MIEGVGPYILHFLVLLHSSAQISIISVKENMRVLKVLHYLLFFRVFQQNKMLVGIIIMMHIYDLVRFVTP